MNESYETELPSHDGYMPIAKLDSPAALREMVERTRALVKSPFARADEAVRAYAGSHTAEELVAAVDQGRRIPGTGIEITAVRLSE